MHYIRDFLRADAIYFANCKKSITAQNNHMLVDGCLLYSLVLAFYTLLSIATRQPAILKNMYFTFDGIHLLLCVSVCLRPARIKENYLATQIFCAAFELSILSFFALEGSITTPAQHSLYVPIAILLLQLLFIHRAAYSALIILLYTASFAVLSCTHKTPEAYTNDVYIALATFISALIGSILIAKLRRNEQQALMKFESLSRTDALTGLYNKAALEQFCKSGIEESDAPCTLIVIDLDDFKLINDAYGHDVGDEVLHSVGAAIKRIFRADDITGRFGGDEFVVLMNACDDPDVVQNRMDSFRQRIEALTFSVPSLAVHYCAGIAYRRENDTFRTLFARADHALYAAKHEGKSRVKTEGDDARG